MNPLLIAALSGVLYFAGEQIGAGVYKAGKTVGTKVVHVVKHRPGHLKTKPKEATK